MNNQNKKFEDWYLHDAELLDIIYNNQKGSLVVKTLAYNLISKSIPSDDGGPSTPGVRSPKRKMFCFQFSDIEKFTVDASSPWGAGIYIFEHQIIKDNLEAGLTHYFFRTNAGDSFDIIAKSVKSLP